MSVSTDIGGSARTWTFADGIEALRTVSTKFRETHAAFASFGLLQESFRSGAVDHIGLFKLEGCRFSN